MQERKKKIIVLIWTIVFSTIIASIYGVIHDHITFSLCNEYYTKFKFNQLNVGPAVPFEIGVTFVGIVSTWWAGLLVGAIIGIIAFFLPDKKAMKKGVIQSLLITFCITSISSFIGYFAGSALSDYPIILTGRYLSADIKDLSGFMIVKVIHFFSYLGCFIGLLVATIRLVLRKRKLQRVYSVQINEI